MKAKVAELHNEDHLVRCQDFRRGLPVPLADAAKLRWEANTRWSEYQKFTNIGWHVKDYVLNRDAFDPISLDLAAMLIEMIVACQETMDDDCAQDLIRIVKAARKDFDTDLEEWVATVTGADRIAA